MFNKLWAETFKSFSKLIEVLPVKGEHIAEYPVFYNLEILVGFKGIFFKSWFDAGIMCIDDFLSDNAVMDYNTFVAKYNIKTDYLTYHGIKNAIQNVIKKYTKTNKKRETFHKSFFPPYLRLLLKGKQERQIVAKYARLTPSYNHPRNFLAVASIVLEICT